MLKYNLTGIPTITNATGVIADPEKQIEVTQASQPEVGIGAAIRAVMALVTSAVMMRIDPIARKLIFEDTDAADLGGAASDNLSIHPKSGQTGRTLEWENGTKSGAFPTDLETAILDTFAPVPPRRSVESQVQAILDAIPETYKERVLIGVNQFTGDINVQLRADAAAARASTTSIVGDLTGANKGVITLSGEAIVSETTGDTSLVFEGGLTPSVP